MKTIILVLASILFTTAHAEKNMATENKKEIVDTFSDKVKDVNEVNGTVEIHFRRHAAIYSLNKENPKFGELKEKLLKLKKEDKVIKVTSTIPKMEITDVKE